MNDFPLGKTTKPIELATRTVMVYKFDGRVFVSDASSTAYQYPLTDAKLSKDPQTGRVSAEVPLVRAGVLRSCADAARQRGGGHTNRDTAQHSTAQHGTGSKSGSLHNCSAANPCSGLQRQQPRIATVLQLTPLTFLACLSVVSCAN